MKSLFTKIDGVIGAVRFLKESGLKDALSFRKASNAVESYMGSQQSMALSRAIQFQEKLDALGMYLSSLIKEDGTIDTKFIGSARKYAESMGLRLHRCFKDSMMEPSWGYDGPAPQFYVESDEVSEEIALYLGQLLERTITPGYQLMRYDYQVVQTANGIVRNFRQTYMGLPVIREKEA